MTLPFEVVRSTHTSTDGFRVIDVETTMNSNLPNKASPFDPKNKLVAMGRENIAEKFSAFVGHNITFDINWLRATPLTSLKKPAIMNLELLQTKTVWDTQLAAYLLSAQQHQFASLDDLALKYGGTVKDSFVSDFFKKGLGADHVPKYKLKEYLVADLVNTRKVFEAQLQEAHEKNMVPLILSQMEGLLATAEMQWNGMHVNRTYLDNQLLLLDGMSAGYDSVIKEICKELSPSDHVFDFTTNKQLSALLYGGTLKYENRVANGVYKTGAKMGQTKYKLDKGECVFPGYFSGAVPEQLSVDDDTLTDIAGLLPTRVEVLVTAILAKRKVDKQRITYFEGHGACVAADSRVHPQHNHTITRTGRLSSSAPNMQNVTSDGLIKKCYESRWGDNGVLLEADYQQLEIVVLAHLSNDPVLKNDLLTGKDMHSELFKSMYGKYPTKEERKPFKRLSFALVYGGGIKAMMANAKVDREIATKFRKVFYDRYQGVKKWHDKLKAQAHCNVPYEGRKTEKGFPSHTYRMVTETGRRYEFHEYDNEWTNTPTYSPTELVNYPVQGTATGDIVPMVLGKLFRRLINSSIYDKCLMINTVHDSVLFDVHKDVLDQAIKLIKETMEAAPTYYKETFGVDFSLPLPVGISVGPNWLDMKEHV